jgi:hypothetical protein
MPLRGKLVLSRSSYAKPLLTKAERPDTGSASAASSGGSAQAFGLVTMPSSISHRSCGLEDVLVVGHARTDVQVGVRQHAATDAERSTRRAHGVLADVHAVVVDRIEAREHRREAAVANQALVDVDDGEQRRADRRRHLLEIEDVEVEPGDGVANAAAELQARGRT